MIPWTIYGAFVYERKTPLTLILLIFLSLNENFLHHSAKLGNNELQMSFVFFALWAFVHPKMERWHWISVTLLAWFKQSTLLFLPFYWIYLFKKDQKSLASSLILCVWIIFFYIARDFPDFYKYCVSRHEWFLSKLWLDKFGSLIENYSITTLINAVGYSSVSFWESIHSYLSKLRCIGFFLIFMRACFRIHTPLDVLKYFVVAFIWFFFFTKGFVFAIYWIVVLLPIVVVGLEIQKNNGLWKGEGGAFFLKMGSVLAMSVMVFAAIFQLSQSVSSKVSFRSEISKFQVFQAHEEKEGLLTLFENINNKVIGDENNPFESHNPRDVLVIEFVSPISLESLEIMGVCETAKNPYGICQTLTDFDVDFWSDTEMKFMQGIQIRNYFFNGALDPMKIKLDQLPLTSKILLRGRKIWDGTTKGFVIRSLKIFSKDSFHAA